MSSVVPRPPKADHFRVRARIAASSLVVGAALLSPLFPSPAAAAPAPAASAPVLASAGEPKRDPARITVKFKDGVDVAAGGDRLAFGSAPLQRRVDAILGRDTVDETDPVFAQSPAKLDAERARLAARGHDLTDLTTFVTVALTHADDSATVIAKLKADPQVEDAYVAAGGELATTMPRLATLQTQQFASAAATPVAGLGITPAASVPGALGGKAQVAVIEYGFNPTHEDIPGSVVQHSPASADWGDNNKKHGTATVGVIASPRNGIGIDGIAPQTQVHFYDATNGRSIESRMMEAVTNELQPGDVIQIAIHGVSGGSRESIPEFRAAASYAVAAGVSVVLASGNYNHNLDDLGTAWSAPRSIDSGTILVGAGFPADCHGYTPRNRLLLSATSGANYGSRVDVQAPGLCVPAPGVWFLDPDGVGTSPNQYYYEYSGTSSASAMTSGVAVALSSAYEEATGAPLLPGALRDTLVATGSAQPDPQNGLVGPQVNLKGAIDAVLAAPDTAIGATSGTDTRPTFAFSTPTLAVTGYDCRIVPIGGATPAWAPCSSSSSHQPAADLADGQYRFEVRARKGTKNGGIVDASPATKTFWVVTNAGDFRIDGTKASFTAKAGHANTLQAAQGASTYIVHDEAQKVRAGAGCTQLDLNTAQCVSSALNGFLVDAGDLNDTVAVTSSKTHSVIGGDGNDAITGGAGYARLDGNAGTDSLTAGTGGSTLDGGPGADTLTGGTGEDAVDLSERTDALVVDLLSGSIEGADTTLGNDTLGGTIDVVIGGEAGDTFVDAPGTQKLFGLGGDDEFWSISSGDDLFYGGEGADSFVDGAGNDQYFGDSGADSVRLNSVGGNDEITGGDDTDVVTYETFSSAVTLTNDDVRNDGVQGVAAQLDDIGSDVENLIGGTGPDTLIASTTTGVLQGLGGNDTLVSAVGAGGGLYGGPGTDTVDFSGRTTNVALTPLSTADIVARFGGAGLGVLRDIDRVIGTEQADVLASGTGGAADRALVLEGRGGDDTLTGGSAGDTLIGGAGTDTFNGNAGNDTLTAKDGIGETVTCGAGTDTASVDAADVRSACETVTF